MANKDKLIESAQKFLAKGQLARAIGEYQKLVDAFPKDFRHRQKLAELLSRERRNEEAQPHYEAVARNFTETGFYLKAIAIYRQMQKLEPNRDDIYLRLAELNEKQGLTGNALNEYRNLLSLHEKNRRPQETLVVLRKMLALDPENRAIRTRLIETLLAEDNPAEALEQFCALDRILSDRGDKAGVASLHKQFAQLHAQTDHAPVLAGASPEAAGPADTGTRQPASGGDNPGEEPCSTDQPELGLGRERAVEGGAPASPVAAVEPAVGAASLEIDLELDLDVPDAVAAAALTGEPPGDGSANDTDGPVVMVTPESLVLPDFCDLGFDLGGTFEGTAGEPTASGLFPDGSPDAVIDSEPVIDDVDGEPAEAGCDDALDVLEDVAVAAAAPEDELYEALEDLEELEELGEAAGEESTPDPALATAAVAMAGPGDADDGAAAASQPSDEDVQSHFDLGIAYKEMGLLDEAIAEFSKAAHEPSRRLDCLTLQGQCRVSMGQYDAAEAVFKEALANCGQNGAVRVALRYELGLLYECAGRLLEALESFEFVADHDQFFREVAAKQKDLRKALGLDDQVAEAARSSRDRISYL